MTVKVASFQNFYGGWATDLRLGPKTSFPFSQAFDFRKFPSQMSVLPGLTREDGGVVKDLVLKEVMTASGVIYAYGNAGYFYKRSTAGVWSAEGKLSTGTGGMDYRKDADSIYLTSSKTASLYNQVSTTSPSLFADFYGSSFSTYNNSDNVGFNVNAYQVGSILTTALQTTIIEQITNLRYFQTDIEPLVKVSVFIVSKGTGNITLTLHDGLNNVLGVKTIANASLVNNTFNDFFFTAATNGQVRVYPAPNARTYHIHVTSSDGTGTISSTGTNDMSTCDLEIWADRLIVTNNQLHPMIRYQQFEAIGNANYLSIWEPITTIPTNSEWQRHRLVFPEEYEVCGLAVQNEFIVVAAEKNTTINTSTPQEGILFFWDGLNPTYNFFVEIPEGSPFSLKSYKNIVYYFAGGAWYAITGVGTQPVKLRTMPGSDNEFSGLIPAANTVGSTGNPLTATLVDNFSSPGSIPSTTLWDTFGNVSQSNGILSATTNTAAGSHGVISHIGTYDLTGSSMQVRLIDAGNQALTSLEVFPVLAQLNASNQLFWYVNQGTIAAYKRIAGVNTQIASATYVSSTFQYLRIRESSGTIYWDYSSDGVTWTNLTSLAAPFVITSLFQEIDIGNFNVEASATTCLFDDYNVTIASDYAIGYPELISVRRGVMLAGYPAITANPNTDYGVYSWGAVDKNYPNSFGYSYVLSTGDQNFTPNNNLQIGMVKTFGDILHVSWRDDLNTGTPRYGVDVINNTSSPAPVAIWQSPVVDGGYVAKYKTGLYMEAYFDMPEGATITMAYSIDQGDWIEDSTSYSSTNLWQGVPGYARFSLTDGNGGRFHELQVQITVVCTSSVVTPPVVSMVSAVYDSNNAEVIQ